MKDGADEMEEPVKKHARHEEGHMPGSESTDPMPMSSRPLPRLPQKQVKRKHLLLVAKGHGQALGGNCGEDLEEWSKIQCYFWVNLWVT